jgi:hypothetical protein
MKNLSTVIVEKLTAIAIEKGYDPNERGKLKELARKYLEKGNYKSTSDAEKDKELNKLYRSLRNFFLSDMQYTSDTLDIVLHLLQVEDVYLKCSTLK